MDKQKMLLTILIILYPILVINIYEATTNYRDVDRIVGFTLWFIPFVIVSYWIADEIVSMSRNVKRGK